MQIRQFAIAIFLFFACAISQAQSYPQVIIPGDYPDPTVMKDGEDYYMTHSPFYYQPGFLIWHSRDLMNWTPICRAMTEWEGSAMAPDLQKVGDTYYIYYPAGGTNWVITAKDIRGPWTAPVDLKIGGIDPGLVVTPEGKRFLFTSAGQVTPLTDDGLARDGHTETVYDGWQYPREWKTECMCLESPKLNYRNGWYYMTSAEGGTAGPATSHMVVSARSRSLYGPWENSPYNPIVHTYSADEKWWSKGHGSLIEGPDGQWWIIYHAYQNGAYSLGRQTLIEPIEWTEGGWFRPVKDLPVATFPTMNISLSDDFVSPTLGWQWTGWKENIAGVATFRKGALHLPARGESPKDGRVMLMTAMHTKYAIEVEVNVGKKNEGGLLLYYNENAYAGLTSDGKTFTIHTDASTSEQVPNRIGRRFNVRIENFKGKMKIRVSADGKKWETLKQDVDVSMMHHNNYHGFYALRPALYSAQMGETIFRNFEYKTIAPTDEELGGYVMVYHKDADHGLHMAYSWDGYEWTALNDDKPIMTGDTIAEQKGIRDPYIFRSPDGGFCVAMTDLHVFGQRDSVRTTEWERPNKYGWGNNRGLVLLKSFDLVHWKRTNLDFTKLTTSDLIIRDWKDAGCIWAPEMNYDEEEDKIMMHFTTRYMNGRNIIYYVYMNDDFTKMISKPEFLFGAARDERGIFRGPAIDSDITKIGDTYHMLMVQFGFVKHATSKKLTGPYIQDNLYKGETQRHEAPCAWRLIGTNDYMIMFDNYSRDPHNFGLVKTSDFIEYTPMGYFDEENCRFTRTNFSEQKHGGVVAVTKAELEYLIKHWE